MRILIIGDELNLREFEAKFGSAHEYTLVDEHRDAAKYIGTNDIIFDFNIDQEPDQFEIYINTEATVFLNTCKVSLAELVHLTSRIPRATFFGFNGLPTFVNRNVLEASVYDAKDLQKLEDIARKLGTELMVVDDRVGMVTPRVIVMIINEAFYAVQEGTASKADIDLAMKLGTNYPYGPFEWAQRIGVHHVYELLEALYDDTRDERYKICPLLKKEYLKAS